MFFLQEEKDVGDQPYQSHLFRIRHLKPKLITNLNYQQDYIIRGKEKRKKQRSLIKRSNQENLTVKDSDSFKNQQETQYLLLSDNMNQHRGVYKSVYDGNDKISGYWQNGLLHGQAEIYYSNGDYFKGKFQKGCKLEGKMVYKDEGVYEGEFFNQQFHGNGILIIKDKKISCQWLNGAPEGNCVVEYSSGSVYYGELKDFKKHGFGYMYFPNDTKFVGQFADGQIKGYGQYFEKGIMKYKGIWRDGKLLQQKKDQQWQKIDKQQSVNWALFQTLINQNTNDLNEKGQNKENLDTLQDKYNSTCNSQNKKQNIERRESTKNQSPLSIFSFLKHLDQNQPV